MLVQDAGLVRFNASGVLALQPGPQVAPKCLPHPAGIHLPDNTHRALAENSYLPGALTPDNAQCPPGPWDCLFHNPRALGLAPFIFFRIDAMPLEFTLAMVPQCHDAIKI